MQTYKHLDILIVGGGIAGLTVAFLLEQLGHNLEIIERNSHWNPLGGGITLMPNGMKLLIEIGAGKQVQEKGLTIKQIKITDAQNNELSCFNIEQYNATFAPTITIHRTDLHEILRSKLTRSPIHFDLTPVSIEEQENKTRVVFSDKRVGYYDLVIGCDGMHSSVRKALFSKTSLNYSGYSCWRFVSDKGQIVYDENSLTEMWGAGKRFGIVPLNGKRLHCFASINASVPENLRTLPVDRFRSYFNDFGGIVPQLLDKLTDGSKLLFNRIEDVHVENWVSGRVVLIGDAAHGMTPNLTQGASLAIEDAVCLYNVLKESKELNKSLQDYFKQRSRRVQNIQRKSALLGKIGQWESPMMTGIRNFCWKKIPDKWIQKDLENLLIR